MNTQLIGLVLLAVIVASNFIDFKSLFKDGKKSETLTDSVDENMQPVIKPSFPVEKACDNSVFCAVQKWEELKKYCEAAGLKQASAKLDEIFPLLALKEEKNV
jgi:hypothetical protein